MIRSVSVRTTKSVGSSKHFLLKNRGTNRGIKKKKKVVSTGMRKVDYFSDAAPFLLQPTVSEFETFFFRTIRSQYENLSSVSKEQ